MMIRFSLWLGIIAICFGCSPNKPVKTKSPNIILIVADDLGYQDVGFNGGEEIKTPNIDRIAARGAQFTNGYVSYPVCGPSRAGLMTGRYQDRFGFSRNPLFAPKDISQGIPLSEQTIAEALESVGYQNMAIGKWHLGAHPELRPLKRGFHEFFGFLSGGHNYLPTEWNLSDISEVRAQYDPYRTKLLRNDQRVDEDEYLTDALSREAVRFINTNKDKPFFLYLAYNAPHGPLQATEKYLQRYSFIENRKRRTYAAMVSALDDGIGEVLNELDRLKLTENTLVIFLSDNGGRESLGADNGPLNKGKGSLFEGGVRVPFAMQWPAVIPGGILYDKPIISLDIFSTVKAITAMETKNSLDGINLIPYLTGEASGSPHDYLFWRKFDQNGIAVRSDNFKLVREDEKTNVFKITEDISEQMPLTGNMVDKSGLLDEYKNWNNENIDPVFLGLKQDKEYSELHPDRFRDIPRY